MKGTHRAVVAGVMVMILMANPVLLAWGNPIPGRWEKVAETKLGEKIKVYIDTGREGDYFFKSVNNDFLTCVDQLGGGVRIGCATIRKITLYKRGEYVKKGALYGLISGAAVGGAIGAADPVEGAFLMVPYLAATGAVVGLIYGALTGTPQVIYISKEEALK